MMNISPYLFGLIWQSVAAAPDDALRIEKLAGGHQYRISFEPLGLFEDEKEQILGLKLINLPSPIFPPPQIIEDKDTVEFDVLVNQKTGQKVIDRLTIDSSKTMFGFRFFN
jgi:hypothetical protein